MGQVKRSPRALLPVAGAGFGGLGVVLIVVGTFLPWFRSGSTRRDSYQAIGLIRFYRLLDGSPFDPLLTVWVGLTPAITLCVVAYALGLRRTAACVAGVLAVLTGTVATVAVVQVDDGGLLGVAGTGPAVTLTGSALVLLGAIGVLAGPGKHHSTSTANTTGGTP
ncbi:hypothetical protein EV186_108197 [Labedaea rhizosphaerae]|uniref:Uncharacterized protein n=1 Tax=Labedaea rhizosphaerae TaxID=598644 RepID=A0A4R6RYN4_LABRH|nr:hypothetical protein EV186_108197 [Labedaea rhizosphaerae]